MPSKSALVTEIYAWVEQNFPFFTTERASTSWRNSIRHNLSMNASFTRQGTPQGSRWRVDETDQELFGIDGKRLPGTKPSPRSNASSSAAERKAGAKAHARGAGASLSDAAMPFFPGAYPPPGFFGGQARMTP